MSTDQLRDLLLQRLRHRGWRQNQGYAARGNPRVLNKVLGRAIAVVSTPTPAGGEDPAVCSEAFFLRMQGIIRRNGIYRIYLLEPLGDTLPEDFRAFCASGRIDLVRVSPDTIHLADDGKLN